MCAGKLDVDPVSVDAEYFGAGEIGDCQGIVDRWTIDKIEGVFVGVGEEENEGGECVPERCGRRWHILESILWMEWHGSLRLRLRRVGPGQKAAVKRRGEDCGVGHVEWNHRLLHRRVKHDLSSLR